MNRYMSTFPNRTLCAVLDDMRSCLKSLNFGAMLGLIEELQLLGNRMEAGLEDQRDVRDMLEYKSKLKSEIDKLIIEKESLSEGKKRKGKG